MVYIGHPPKGIPNKFNEKKYYKLESDKLTCIICPPSIQKGSLDELKKMKSSDEYQIHIFAEENMRPRFDGIKFIPIQKILLDYPSCGNISKFKKLEDPQTWSNENFINISDLPKMLIDDPMAIWSNASVGDIIEIEQPNKITGINKAYRLVIEE